MEGWQTDGKQTANRRQTDGKQTDINPNLGIGMLSAFSRDFLEGKSILILHHLMGSRGVGWHQGQGGEGQLDFTRILQYMYKGKKNSTEVNPLSQNREREVS